MESFEQAIWKELFFISISLATFMFVYVCIYTGTISFWHILGMTAGTSGIFLAISFSLSSFAYFFDFLDRQLIYRKYCGLLGYYLAVVYAMLASIQKPDFYVFGFFKNFWTVDIALGFVAMSIFTLMAFVSQKGMPARLGSRIWKNILRLGYFAYALLVIRGFILDWSLWQVFWQSPGLLSPRMILTILGTLVLFFRFTFLVHSLWKKKDV